VVRTALEGATKQLFNTKSKTFDNRSNTCGPRETESSARTCSFKREMSSGVSDRVWAPESRETRAQVTSKRWRPHFSNHTSRKQKNKQQEPDTPTIARIAARGGIPGIPPGSAMAFQDDPAAARVTSHTTRVPREPLMTGASPRVSVSTDASVTSTPQRRRTLTRQTASSSSEPLARGTRTDGMMDMNYEARIGAAWQVKLVGDRRR